MDAVLAGLVAGIVAFVSRLVTQHWSQQHQEQLQNKELEHQTRAALRETYDRLLVAQRRSRTASMELAHADGASDSEARRLDDEAAAAHAAFIEQYHLLNLDATPEVWIEARGLRHVLDNLVKAGRARRVDEAERLEKLARRARQNLERSLRSRLGQDVLQLRNPLGEPYDKIAELAQVKVRSKAPPAAAP
jgi:hypothetical protein